MSTNSDSTFGDDTIHDRVRGQSDEGGMLSRGDSGGAPDSGPDDGMGPNDPDDIAGEDEPVPGIDDEAEDDR